MTISYQRPDLWSPPDSLPRRWFASGPWDGVWLLRFQPTDPMPDGFSEYPPTVAVDRDGWLAGAFELFGVDIDGAVVDVGQNIAERPGTDDAPGRWAP